MPKYTMVTGDVEAVKWDKHGDHPAVVPEVLKRGPAANVCDACGRLGAEHGRVKTAKGYLRVCPGDMIVGLRGGYLPVSPGEFSENYTEEIET